MRHLALNTTEVANLIDDSVMPLDGPQKLPYPPVARSVGFCRSASLVLAIVACLLTGVSYLASQYVPGHRTLPGYLAMTLSVLSIGCNIYISKLSTLDATLGKRRDNPLPWSWWLRPKIGLVLAFIGLALALCSDGI